MKSGEIITLDFRGGPIPAPRVASVFRNMAARLQDMPQGSVVWTIYERISLNIDYPDPPEVDKPPGQDGD